MREKEKKKERLLQRLEGDGPLFLTPGKECPPPVRETVRIPLRGAAAEPIRDSLRRNHESKKNIFEN